MARNNNNAGVRNKYKWTYDRVIVTRQKYGTCDDEVNHRQQDTHRGRSVCHHSKDLSRSNSATPKSLLKTNDQAEAGQ